MIIILILFFLWSTETDNFFPGRIAIGEGDTSRCRVRNTKGAMEIRCRDDR